LGRGHSADFYGAGNGVLRSDADHPPLDPIEAALRGSSKPMTSGLIAASAPPSTTLSCAPLNRREELRDNFDLIDKPSDKMARVNEGDTAQAD
jgi:hypothetical protein